MRIQKNVLAGATVAMVLIMSSAALAAHHGGHGKKKGQRKRLAGLTAVQVASARHASILSEMQFSGVGTPLHTLTLTSPAAGTVANVMVKVGQSVAQGQVLSVVSSPLLSAKIGGAEAVLAGAQSKLAAAQQPPSVATIANANLQVQKALLSLNQAQAQEQSAQSSHASSVQSSQDQMAVQVAEANVAASEDALSAAKQPPDASAVQTLQSAVAQARASLEGVQTEVHQLTLTAPFSGTVTAVPGFTGESVTVGSSMVALNTANLQIQSTIPEVQRASMHLGQTAWTHWGNHSAVRGQVASIAPVATALSFPFTIALSSTPTHLWPGESVTTDIVTAHTTGVIIPSQAIVNINGHTQVFVVKHRMVQLVNVKPGITNGSDTAVTGITQSTTVVTLGKTYLAPGDKVRVTAHMAVPSTLVGADVTGFVSQFTPSQAGTGKKSGKAGGGKG